MSTASRPEAGHAPAVALDPAIRELLATVLLPRLPPYDPVTQRLGHLASLSVLAGEPADVHAVDGFTIDPDPRLGTPRLAVRRYQPRAGETGWPPAASTSVTAIVFIGRVRRPRLQNQVK